MRKFIINPLSANGQCHTTKDAANVFEELISSIKYIWPMIQKNRASLRYDVCGNVISLCKDETFETTLNKIRSINGDLRRLWFMYIKNQPSIPENTIVNIAISTTAIEGSPSLTGMANQDAMTNDVQWLSFGGNAFNRASKYQVCVDRSKLFEVMNAHSEESLQNLLPVFKHSNKHREKSHRDYDRNEEVAAMPIRDEKIAGDLLRIGIEHGKSIYSYHSASSKFYRFNLTGNNIYHGFLIEQDEVPHPLHAKLKE
jgi:hypothetical protein